MRTHVVAGHIVEIADAWAAKWRALYVLGNRQSAWRASLPMGPTVAMRANGTINRDTIRGRVSRATIFYVAQRQTRRPGRCVAAVRGIVDDCLMHRTCERGISFSLTVSILLTVLLL